MTALTAQRPGTAFAPSPALRGAALSAGAIIALASAEGGFFPSSWRVGAVALGALACVHALWAPARRTTTAIPLLAPLVAFGLLSVGSAVWSVSPSASLLDAQRTLLYVAALASFALAGEGLVAGVAVGAGTIGAWALATRLVHGTTVDPFEGRLLTGPLGYANGLGALAAIGIAVCAVAALARRDLRLALPLGVLVPTLVLTESRGAEAAVVIGCVVGAAVAARRPAVAGAVLGVSTALLTALYLWTPAAAGDRLAYWDGARETAVAHPLGGTGAGTFGLVHDAWPYARDAHSLYLQALSELGVPGLLLLVAFVTFPLVLAIRRGLAAPAAGLAVFALHAGIDWDWQLPAVTVAALALMAAAARPTRSG
ncbi:MAG TPA: O-antigen ligase family protein [Gaiellaceae bacterium]|nr:O-antigen ligase family protein [Gaiellaceae bacterium]